MRRRAYWLLFGLLLVPITWIGWRVYTSAVTRAQRDQAKQNLKQIGLALHAYHDDYGSFPPAYLLGADEKPWHSWRVLLLPYLGEQQLYGRYRFDEPWDGPHNRELKSLRPKVYKSPLQQSEDSRFATALAVVSRRTMWPACFPVRIEQVTDGISNTIQLIENDASDITWTEPRDLRERDALSLLKSPSQKNAASRPVQSIFVLFADGAVHLLSPQINRDLFVSLLTPAYRQLMVSDDLWPHGLLPNDHPAVPVSLPEPVAVDQFPATRVLCVPDLPLEAYQSVLYCATIQIAWDQLRPEASQPVVVLKPPRIAETLNAHPFPLDALSKDTYFVGASGLSAAQSGSLFDSFRNRFPTAPTEMLKPIPEVVDFGHAVRILAHLQKLMPFPDVMERISEPLRFPAEPNGKLIQSFGWQSAPGEGALTPVLPQTVTVRDFVSGDDFILSLQTNSQQQDEILLAKVAPQDSLQATWDSVAGRLRTPLANGVETELRAVDQLQIPILSFGVLAKFPELSFNIPTKASPDRFIAEALQTIQFRLDEYGAELISDMQMVVADDVALFERQPEKPRHFIFNQPFLIAIREYAGETPYFLAWIGNADLMEPAK